MLKLGADKVRVEQVLFAISSQCLCLFSANIKLKESVALKERDCLIKVLSYGRISQYINTSIRQYFVRI